MPRFRNHSTTAFLAFAVCFFTTVACFAQTSDQRTAAYFDSIHSNPLLLEAFLREMPKGGDLHNHLSGAVYAEHYIQFAIADKLCVDTKSMSFVPPPCDESRNSVPADTALRDPILYRGLLDAMSMRNFHPEIESGEDRFFDTFGKFHLVSRNHTGEMLAEVVSRAGWQNESYLELIIGLDHNSGPLATKLGWNDDFDRMRERLAPGIRESVAQMRSTLDAAEAQKNDILHCNDAAHADPGCKVTLRYIAEVYRGTPKEQVFAEIMAGFEAVHSGDKRYVAVNPVMPEDGYLSMHDYELHMKMFDYFHKIYPDVHLTEHAGEIAPGFVPPDGLRFHIREAIELGHAQRIGHGVDVMEEDRPLELLKEMAQKNVAVEICLTSNDVILGVRGDRHPFPIYMKYGVPVAIATDDEGVSRSDLTREYTRAVESYGLSYAQVKKLVRNSLEYSFAELQAKANMLADLDERVKKFESHARDAK
jgi:adenosine deaminase